MPTFITAGAMLLSSFSIASLRRRRAIELSVAPTTMAMMSEPMITPSATTIPRFAASVIHLLKEVIMFMATFSHSKRVDLRAS